MTVLDQIVAATRVRLATEAPPDVRAAERFAAAHEPHRFEKALRRDAVASSTRHPPAQAPRSRSG